MSLGPDLKHLGNVEDKDVCNAPRAARGLLAPIGEGELTHLGLLQV